MKNSQILKRRKKLKLVLLYIIMSFSIIITVMFMIFFILGYRFDANKGQIEQHAFLQFNSFPTGATIKVDGVELGSKTPSKTSIPAGKHEIIMQKSGYERWSKIIDIKPGTMTWMDYAILVPNKPLIESVLNFTNIHDSLTSEDGRNIIVQESELVPDFTIVDISNDVIKSTKISLLTDLYSLPVDTSKNSFKLNKWDPSGRYVLADYITATGIERLVIDTQDVAKSKNISRFFNLSIDDIDFYGTNGKSFYILNAGDVRKINISDSTISKPLISRVKSFNIDHVSNIVSFTGFSDSDANVMIVGLYRDGDASSHIMRTVPSNNALSVVTSHYFNEDYVGILDGKKIDILRGSYPTSQVDILNSFKQIYSFTIDADVRQFNFNPNGQYLIASTTKGFTSYDLEYQKISTTSISGVADNYNIGWLNDDYLWTDRDGKLNIFEFDGANSHQLTDTFNDQSVSITHNTRYIYNFVKTNATYQLQRIKLILN